MTTSTWKYESDGDGIPRKRRDQYVVSFDGLRRIATFEWYGEDACKNARLTAKAPELFRSLRAIVSQIKDGRHGVTEAQVIEAETILREATD